MGMFGIKPAVIVKPIEIGQDWKGKERVPCDCRACVQLRQVSIRARIGQGAAVLVMAALGLGGASLVLSLLVWGVVAVVRQL